MAGAMTAWLREAYFGQVLDGHPRAIRVFDAFPVAAVDGLLYCLALEYASEGDLRAYLHRNGKGWPETTARREIAGGWIPIAFAGLYLLYPALGYCNLFEFHPEVLATSTLIARSTTHPAIMQLFVQAAQRIHGGTGWFARAGQFPIGEDAERPLAAEAARFYRNGAPVLQRYLPFGLANLIDRMWVALLSIVAVLIPLSRVVPPVYQFRIRSRVFRWYGQLRRLEDAASTGSAPPEKLLADLDEIESNVERVTVPLSHADELYALRGHIDMVRDRLRLQMANGTAGTAGTAAAK